MKGAIVISSWPLELTWLRTRSEPKDLAGLRQAPENGATTITKAAYAQPMPKPLMSRDCLRSIKRLIRTMLINMVANTSKKMLKVTASLNGVGIPSGAFFLDKEWLRKLLGNRRT